MNAATPALEGKMRQLWALDAEVMELEEKLKDLKALRKEVGENELTDMVTDENAHDGVFLSDGTVWRFERQFKCGINAGDREAMHAWLQQHGVGHMLRHRIVLEFPANADEMLAKTKRLLYQLLPHFELQVVVDASIQHLGTAVADLLQGADLIPMIKISEETALPGPTLSSFVKKAYGAGIALPPEMNVYAPMKAKQIAGVGMEGTSSAGADVKPAPQPERQGATQ